MTHWVKWVIERNMPLSGIENELTRRFTNLKPITTRALKDAMSMLTVAVQTEIAAELPPHFGLTFDGWSDGSTHYCAILALYEVDGVRKTPLLAMSPLIDEDRLDADAHVAFIDATLEVFGRDRESVGFLVADNCAVNGSIARKFGVPMVGCYSHKLNLAVQLFLKPHEKLLAKVQNLMQQLKRLGPGGELRKFTELRPVTRNLPRWSSAFAMLDRFLTLLPVLDDMDTVVDYMPTRAQITALKCLHEHLARLESVTKKLQLDGLDLADARALFDGVLEKYPEMRHLDTDNALVRYPDFDPAITKVLNECEDDLTESEAASISCFMKFVNIEDSDEDDLMAKSFADGILASKRRKTTKGNSKYIPLGFVGPTSNVVERLFSSANFILADCRKHMHPINFEMILFFRVNGAYWGVNTLATVMQ